MAKSGKKKSSSRAAKPAAKGRSARSAAAKKKVTKKKPAAKKVTKKKVAKKKTAKKSPAKKAPAKKSKKKAPAKKKAVKKTAKKAPARKAAKTTKKKAAAKKSATKKKSVTKKKVTKKKAAAKAPAKSAKKTTKKAAQKTAKKSVKKRAPVRTVKPPKVPYAALSEAPPVAASSYDPYNNTPPSMSQLRKIKTELTRKDMNHFRRELLQRRAEIIGDVQGLEAARSGSAGEISHMPLHMADVGSDNYEQEFMLGLMESERKTIIEIDEALQRLADRVYGVCVESGVPISRPRLEAKPWAKYCIEVARERERRGL